MLRNWKGLRFRLPARWRSTPWSESGTYKVPRPRFEGENAIGDVGEGVGEEAPPPATDLRRPPVTLGGKPGEDAGFRPQMGGLEPSLTLVNAVRRQASSLSPLNQSSPQSDK